MLENVTFDKIDLSVGIIEKQGLQGTILTYSGVIIGFITAGYLLPKYLTQEQNGVLDVINAWSLIFATLATTALQTKYQKLVTPTKAGIVYSFEPILAAVIAYMAIGERITTFGLIGASLIFLGLIISEVFDDICKYLRKSV